MRRKMKKILFVILLLVLPRGQYAFDLEAGMTFGARTVSDPEIKSVYGSGRVFFPYLALNVFEGFFIGAGYEGGFSKEATIGLYNEPTTLKVSGLEFFIGYEHKIKIISPYLKIGYGSYTYKQTIESVPLMAFPVDGMKSAVSIGGGIKFFPFKYIFLAAEVKYIPLKVKPYDQEVDLGGLRYSVGAGFRFVF